MQPFQGWWRQCTRTEFKTTVRIVEDNVSNLHHDPGYGLDVVTTWREFASAGGHKHSAGLNTVWL
jgi:hypothetical protein